MQGEADPASPRPADPENSGSPVDRARVRAAVAELLTALGEDPTRPELADTPARVADAYSELFAGVGVDASEILAQDALPIGDAATELIALRGIPFRSMCEHHLLPFSGVASVAYLPADRLAGLGRIARAVDVVASRPQMQERMSEQLASAVEDGLGARGVLVVLSASHGCLWARGTRTVGADAVTLASRGELADPARRGRRSPCSERPPRCPSERSAPGLRHPQRDAGLVQ
ncbi:GTP cyclohydrolase I [Naasia aerilata]|uniref:GTP cyclohydrolase I n=1 Tax=Naasia aerilata TaxID=1162966 RepID=UPI002573565B|nr:GTP cyclohydrolase I [Naasia aerilata]